MITSPQNRCAFSLVEVTLALGIAAFCLLAIFGLLPIGLNSNQSSIEQTAAASLTRGIISELRATPKTIPNPDLRQYKITIPATGTSTSTLFLAQDTTVTGAENTDADPSKNPRYRATLYFTPPLTGQRAATIVRVLITWPATADKTWNVDPKKFSGSFEVTTALDRN